MSTVDAPEPDALRIDGPPAHLLLVRAPYYREVVEALSAGAGRTLRASGATFEPLDVAGAFSTQKGQYDNHDIPKETRLSAQLSTDF